MMEASKSFSTESLRLAREMLYDAKLMLQSDRYRSAVDRAYYAMFHASRAALHMDSLELPKTHAGLRNLFGQHFLITDKLPKDLGKWLSQAFRLRQRGDYEVHAEIEEERVQETIANAENFLHTIAAYLQQKPEEDKQ